MGDLRLPWTSRASSATRLWHVRDADERLILADDRHIAEAIVKAMNATHQEPPRMVTPHADQFYRHVLQEAAPQRMVPRREPEALPFGVQTIGGGTEWYATLDEAWMHMGPGRRIVKR